MSIRVLDSLTAARAQPPTFEVPRVTATARLLAGPHTSSAEQPVGQGADEDVGTRTQHGGEQEPALVLQDPIAPGTGLDLGNQDCDLPSAFLRRRT